MLAYDEPAVAPAKIASAPQNTAASFSVGDLVRLLWQKRLAIAAAAMIGAVAAVAIGKSLTPRYTATAQLYVDPRELQLVDRELTPRSQDVSGLPIIVESQARLITSNSVLFKVIEREKLEDDAEFGAGANGGLLSSVGFGANTPETRRNATLEALTRHIVVRRTDRTFIVEIDVWSRDPIKAAKVANAIASAYLEETVETQSASARRATTDLSARLKEMQERLRKAENALAEYKAKNNFVGTQETLVSDQQLSAITQRLATARALTLDAQAKYDQIEASRRAATDIGALPEALQSQTIANLRAQYADARKRQAELMSELGPRHPALRNIENQVDDLRRNINEEVNRIAQAARNDLTRARTYETSLVSALENQKRQSNDMGLAAVRLRELEREVDASRSIYQSFLKRARETQEQETLNTSNARVIGEATPPQRRSFPPAMTLLAAAGFIFGALAGAGGVVAVDRAGAQPQPPGRPRPSEPLPRPVLSTQRRRDEKPAAASPTPVAFLAKPLIARLQKLDVTHVPPNPASAGDALDVTRLGWPGLRPDVPLNPFTNAMRRMRSMASRLRNPATASVSVIAVIGPAARDERTMVALNVALAAAQDGVDVLLVDADAAHGVLTGRIGEAEPQSSGALTRMFGVRRTRVVETSNRITIMPVAAGRDSSTGKAIADAIAKARRSERYGLILLDGPAMTSTGEAHDLLDLTNGVIATLPGRLDVDARMDDILHALGNRQNRLLGVIINEVSSGEISQIQDKAYA